MLIHWKRLISGVLYFYVQQALSGHSQFAFFYENHERICASVYVVEMYVSLF